MSLYNELPDLNHWPKHLNNKPKFLHELFILNSHAIKPHVLRQSIRRAIKDQNTLMDSNLPVFFRQGVSGGTYATAIPEFCQLANQSGQSIIRLQIDVSPPLSLTSHQWYLIVRYCLFCLNLSNSAAIVLFPPNSSLELNLFMIDPTHYSREKIRDGQKAIYQMIGLQIAMWYVKSRIGYDSMNTKGECVFLPRTESPASFMTWAIYKLLTVQRVETIHQLSEQLRLNYQIESDYLSNDYSFNRLRFRHDRSGWIQVEELLLHVYDLRIWLNFNRLTRSDPVCGRILAGVACMGQ